MFSRNPLTALRKILLPTARYQGDEKVLHDLESMRYALRLVRENISIDRQKSDTEKRLEDFLTDSKSVTLHRSSGIPCPLGT